MKHMLTLLACSVISFSVYAAEQPVHPQLNDLFATFVEQSHRIVTAQEAIIDNMIQFPERPDGNNKIASCLMQAIQLLKQIAHDQCTTLSPFNKQKDLPPAGLVHSLLRKSQKYSIRFKQQFDRVLPLSQVTLQDDAGLLSLLTGDGAGPPEGTPSDHITQQLHALEELAKSYQLLTREFVQIIGQQDGPAAAEQYEADPVRLAEHVDSAQPVAYGEEQTRESRISQELPRYAVNCVRTMDPIDEDMADAIIDYNPDTESILRVLKERQTISPARYFFLERFEKGDSVFAKALSQKCGLESIWIDASAIDYEDSQSFRIIFKVISDLLHERPESRFLVIIDKINSGKGQWLEEYGARYRSPAMINLSETLDRLDHEKRIDILATTCNTRGLDPSLRDRFFPVVIKAPNLALYKKVLRSKILHKRNIEIDSSINSVAIDVLASPLNKFSICAIRTIIDKATDQFSNPSQQNPLIKILTTDAIKKAIDWYEQQNPKEASDNSSSWDRYFESLPTVLPVTGNLGNMAMYAARFLHNAFAAQ